MPLALLQPGYDPVPQARRDRLRRLMSRAQQRNAIDLPALGASGPALTMLGATPTAGLGQIINHATNPALFACFGGAVANPSGSRYQAKSATLSAAPTFGSYGQRWAWRSDSAKFDITIFGATAGVFNGFRLLIDGQYVSKSQLAPTVNGSTQAGSCPKRWRSITEPRHDEDPRHLPADAGPDRPVQAALRCARLGRDRRQGRPGAVGRGTEGARAAA